MKSFYIKDISLAEKYGFFKPDPSATRYWWERVRTTVGMVIDEKDNRIRVLSASGDCIAALCEMYKNGDVEIVETEKQILIVRVNEEELKVLEEMRGKKDGMQNPR